MFAGLLGIMCALILLLVTARVAPLQQSGVLRSARAAAPCRAYRSWAGAAGGGGGRSSLRWLGARGDLLLRGAPAGVWEGCTVLQCSLASSLSNIGKVRPSAAASSGCTGMAVAVEIQPDVCQVGDHAGIRSSLAENGVRNAHRHALPPSLDLPLSCASAAC